MSEKEQVYENIFHTIQMYAAVTHDCPALDHLLSIICDWSYAHRQGNGELTDEEQDAMIAYHYERLKNGEFRDSVWNSGKNTRFKDRYKTE